LFQRRRGLSKARSQIRPLPLTAIPDRAGACRRDRGGISSDDCRFPPSGVLAEILFNVHRDRARLGGVEHSILLDVEVSAVGRSGYLEGFVS
jgi:hypothetical protein